MAAKTHLATQQIRLQQWAEMVRECNSRPRGMKIAHWCREYGITKYAYYYQLNRVRKACFYINGSRMDTLQTTQIYCRSNTRHHESAAKSLE